MMNTRVRPSSIALLAALALSACSKDEAPPAPVPSAAPTAPAPPPAPSVAAPATAAASATETKASEGLFADKLPTGLPPLDFSPKDVATMKKSTDLDTKAAKARKRKDYDEATRLFVEALEIDPGNTGARYGLARALVLAGKADASLAVLDQLYRAEDCYPCEGLLLEAARDNDFAAVADRAEFKERTEGIGKKLPTFEHAAKQVLKWLDRPSLDDMPPLVDSRTFIVLERPGAGFKMFKGAEAFIEYVVDNGEANFPHGRKWGGTLGPPLGMSYKCPNECCEINTYEPPGKRNVLRQMCFKAKGNAAIALYKLKVSD